MWNQVLNQHKFTTFGIIVSVGSCLHARKYDWLGHYMTAKLVKMTLKLNDEPAFFSHLSSPISALSCLHG